MNEIIAEENAAMKGEDPTKKVYAKDDDEVKELINIMADENFF